MNFFENDYTQNATELLKEAFKFKKYNAMHPVLAIFTGIFMIPVVLIDLIFAAIMYIWGFAFNLMASPVKFIHDVLRTEGKEVKHATQFIIYWISWPIIFLSYAALSLTVFLLNLFYALLAIFAYIWTLGGFKFHVSVEKSSDCSKEIYGELFWLPLIYVIVCAAVVIAIPLILTIIDCVDYGVEQARYFFEFLISHFLRMAAYALPFSIIYSAVALAPRPKD
jgi:uncharacterized membrane protein